MHLVGFIIRHQFDVLDNNITNFNNILVLYLQMVAVCTKLQHNSETELQETNIVIVLHVNIMSFSIFKSLMMVFYNGYNTSQSVIQYCTTNTAVNDRSLLSTVPPLFLQRLSIKISTTASSSIKHVSLKPHPRFKSKFPHVVPKVKEYYYI